MTADSAKRFKAETEHHTMEIVHDDGLYRHLRFVNPKSGLYWFEITTTPGQLVFSGDGESFVFRVVPDMFKLFRESASGGDINPWYWAEKLQTGNAFSYSEEAFRGYIERDVAKAEGGFPGLREGVQEEILGSLIYDIAHEAPAMMSAVGYEYQVKGESFRFRGTWEWTVKDYDWWYLFACHAIVWGIRQYDAAKAEQAKAAAPVRPGVRGLVRELNARSGFPSPCWIVPSPGRWALLLPREDGSLFYSRGFQRRTVEDAVSLGLARFGDSCEVVVPALESVPDWLLRAVPQPLEGYTITVSGGAG